MNCTVQLTLDEINYVLGLLGKREFDEVAQLILKVRSQVIPQVQAQAAAAAEESSEEGASTEG